MLKNCAVVVTGGASGIGLGIAKAFAEAGAKVCIGGRRKDAVDAAVETVKASEGFSGQIYGHPMDVSNREQVKAFFDWSTKTIGPTNILVQAAGVNIRNRAIDLMTPEEWDQVIAINTTGAYNCMMAVLPAMRVRKDGLIINISSVAGKRAIALGGVAYGASKFAMTALGTCVSNEVASDGVRVTNVYPGEVNTPILDKRPVPVSDEHKAQILQPEDIAAMILAIAILPPRAHVPEIVIKPLSQVYF